MDVDVLGWRPCVETWLAQKKDKEKVEILRRLIEKYIQQVVLYYAAVTSMEEDDVSNGLRPGSLL